MRSRHQEGWVEERGKACKRWYGHYYVYAQTEAGQEVRRHVGVPLGDKSKLRKWEAEKKLREIIAAASRIDQQLRVLIAERNLSAVDQASLRVQIESMLESEKDPAIAAARAIGFLNSRVQPAADDLTLEWFTRERFLPMRVPQWAPSTRETNLYNVNQHILPALGSVVLGKLDKWRCQLFLNDLAQKERGAGKGKPAQSGFSFTVIDHSRTLLKAILEEAVEAELIGRNPARKLVNPETRESEKFVLPKDQARMLLEKLPFRDRLMAMIAAFCAMRPGEIFGLRWSSWRGDHFQIEGTAWRGVLRPGKAKTKGSKAPVAIPDLMIPALEMWREQRSSAPAEALIFPSLSGTPMRPENWLRRSIKPIAQELNISVPVNFQVLRRTFATNAQGYGNPKDVQAHLRHSDIATTLDVYTQSVPESVRKVVNAVAHDVMTSELKGTVGKVQILTERVQ